MSARDESAASDLTPGSIVAERFQIAKLLGRGGMGQVYAATDVGSGVQVALKLMKRGKSFSEEAAERFRREAEILAAVHHPSIVGVHGFGKAQDGTAWLAMELLVGETLRERVTREGALSAEALAPILSGAAEALTVAHEAGIVHRDLKPDHLFLPAGGVPVVKILDFGLSRAAGNKKLTKTGTVLGTPRYMSPEQIASAHASDAQSDVYALGVIVYEALTGKSPFAASDHGQLLGAILQGRVEPLGVARPDLPAGVVDVVHRAMARDQGARYATPRQFAEELCQALGASDQRPQPTAAGGHALRPARGAWHYLLAAVLGVVVAGLGALVGYVLLR